MHKNLHLYKLSKASTYVKLIIINGIISIIVAGIIIAINPAKQIAQANNAKRNENVISILNAIYQYSANNGGILPVELPKPGRFGKISNTEINLCSLLVPKYLPSLPSDPSVKKSENITNCAEEYDTGYLVALDAIGERITVSAPKTQLPLNSPISVSR